SVFHTVASVHSKAANSAARTGAARRTAAASPSCRTLRNLQSVAPKIKHRTISPNGLAPGIYHDLGVSLGIGEFGERAVHAVETDIAGDQRRAVDLALGDVMQALCELLGRVAEHELEIKLLGDAEERFEPVNLHAHADHDDAGPSRRAVHDLLDDSGHAH